MADLNIRHAAIESSIAALERITAKPSGGCDAQLCSMVQTMSTAWSGNAPIYADLFHDEPAGRLLYAPRLPHVGVGVGAGSGGYFTRAHAAQGFPHEPQQGPDIGGSGTSHLRPAPTTGRVTGSTKMTGSGGTSFEDAISVSSTDDLDDSSDGDDSRTPRAKRARRKSQRKRGAEVASGDMDWSR